MNRYEVELWFGSSIEGGLGFRKWSINATDPSGALLGVIASLDEEHASKLSTEFEPYVRADGTPAWHLKPGADPANVRPVLRVVQWRNKP